MIISHKHKFIFFKTSKTAGTSIEIALSKICGDDDVITPVAQEDEIVRAEYGGRPPQNYRVPLKYFSPKSVYDYYIKKKKRFYNHIPCSEVKRIVDNKIWDDYFKVCFERNPYARVVSQYYYLLPKRNRTIKEYMESGDIYRLKKRGFGVYTINGSVAVDKIYKFEDIKDAFDEILSRINIKQNISLPKAKINTHMKKNYREVLNEEAVKKISQVFKWEIDYFNYKF